MKNNNTQLSLNEFHKFQYEGSSFLFNVENLKAFRINRNLFDKITNIQEGRTSANACSAALIRALDELGILQEAPIDKVIEKGKRNNSVKHISLNISQSCNLKCIYCYGGEGEYGLKGLMDEKTAFKAIDWLVQHSLDSKRLVLTFFGGEPLLNFKLIKKVVRYTKSQSFRKSKEFHFSITTNGILLTSEIISYLNKNKFSVVISIDGDLEIQNRNRPFKRINSDHNKTFEKIHKFLISRNGDATARATITRHNSNTKQIRDFLIEMGFQRIVLSQASIDANNSCIESCGITMQQKLDILSDLENQAAEIIRDIKNCCKPKTKVITEIIKALHQREKKKYYCGIGKGYLAVSISGDIFPCHRFVGHQDFLMGNIFQDEIENKKYIKNFGFSQKKCVNCWSRYLCGGGCMHNNFLSSNSLYEPDEDTCRQIRRTIEMAIYVYNELNENDLAFLKKRTKSIK